MCVIVGGLLTQVNHILQWHLIHLLQGCMHHIICWTKISDPFSLPNQWTLSNLDLLFSTAQHYFQNDSVNKSSAWKWRRRGTGLNKWSCSAPTVIMVSTWKFRHSAWMNGISKSIRFRLLELKSKFIWCLLARSRVCGNFNLSILPLSCTFKL